MFLQLYDKVGSINSLYQILDYFRGQPTFDDGQK